MRVSLMKYFDSTSINCKYQSAGRGPRGRDSKAQGKAIGHRPRVAPWVCVGLFC